MSTQLTPFVLIPDTTEAVLDYLVQRTAATIGALVDQSGVVVVGSVQEVAISNVPVRPEHVAALEPWLSGQAGAGAQLVIQTARVHIEDWLVGPERAPEILVVGFLPGATSGPALPILRAQERGLFFLTAVPADVPYAPYLPRSTYQFAPGEVGVRSFLVTDYDERGQPFTRDETPQIQQIIAAVRWYAALPVGEPTALHDALHRALDHANPRVTRHAIRALANAGDPAAADAFRARLHGATEDRYVRLMLGLWILRQREFAGGLLQSRFHEEGRYPWLLRWGLQPSGAKEGPLAGMLSGPDPSELKGD